MSKEPSYVAYTSEPLSDEAARAWYEHRAREAHDDKGCHHIRYTWEEDEATGTVHRLVEGWVAKPDDEGPPRWDQVRKEVYDDTDTG